MWILYVRLTGLVRSGYCCLGRNRNPGVFCSFDYIDRFFFFFSSRRRHTRCLSDWSSDVCSSDLMSFVQRRSDDTKKYIFLLFAALAAIVSLVTVVIAEVSWRGWVAGLKAVIRGDRKSVV